MLWKRLSRTKRVILVLGGLFATLVGLAVGSHLLLIEWQGRPFCHKQIQMGFLVWMDDRKTDAFPNVAGDSRSSLNEIRDEMNGMAWAKGYRYVPGLRQDDPGDLVLMYLDRPTRWTWHGSHPTVFKEKAWIIVPVDFVMSGRPKSGQGELSERVSLDELCGRLGRTLDFLRTNDRPHWPAVVADHKKFLDSLNHPSP